MGCDGIVIWFLGCVFVGGGGVLFGGSRRGADFVYENTEFVLSLYTTRPCTLFQSYTCQREQTRKITLITVLILLCMHSWC